MTVSKNRLKWMGHWIGHQLPLAWLLVLVTILVVGCAGGTSMSRSDAALFSKALGDALQQQNYSKVGASYDAKQVALAQQSGLSNDDVVSTMFGLQSSLAGNYALDANFKLASDLLSAINGSDKLTDLASDKLESWLIKQGQDKVLGKLKDFLKKQGQRELEEMLNVAGQSGMEYGFFAGAGTFWFRNPQTGEYITVTFADHNGEQLGIITQGVAEKKTYDEYPGINNFKVHIDTVDLWRDVKEAPPPQSKAKCCEQNPQRLQVVTSIDPNDLLFSPAGYGDAGYITEDQVISYTIRFENQATALAPAIDVTVIAQLGPGIDLESVLLGPSSHPNMMTAEISESNNSITWFFKDIMLSPNQTAPEGEGWVRFSAKPKPGLVSGTPLSAKAAIRFDYNPPIETNEVIYTLDSGAPATQVGAMTQVQLSPSFEIPWTGSDDAGGSGLQNVALLASEDGGPFKVVGASSAQAIPFQGEPGKTYSFATVGLDHVGHLEAVPEIPDATVTIGKSLSLEPGWHLVGVPVVTDQSPLEQLAQPGTAWSAWDSAQQAYLSVGLGSSYWPTDSFDLPGVGLWANFDQGVNYYITGKPVPIDQPYAIELKPGWNLIANPFPSSVKWDLNALRVKAEDEDLSLAQAQAQGWVEDFAWGWKGDAYSLVYDSNVVEAASSEIEPFQGYWFQSYRQATLLLPPPAIN